jgi:hypothetical protein
VQRQLSRDRGRALQTSALLGAQSPAFEISFDQMTKFRPRAIRAPRFLHAATAACCLLAALALGAQAAQATQVLRGLATAHLHLVRAEGSTLIEEGPVSGVLNGTARARLKTGASYSASFMIFTRAGTISGTGTAMPAGSGRYQSFKGTFHAIGGSRRYAHIKGQAGLYGVFDRRADSVVVQTSGTLSY